MYVAIYVYKKRKIKCGIPPGFFYEIPLLERNWNTASVSDIFSLANIKSSVVNCVRQNGWLPVESGTEYKFKNCYLFDFFQIN